MKHLAILPFAALAMACVPVAEPGEPAPPTEQMPGDDGACNADGAQQYIGQYASKTVGEQIVAATGARMFQWVGPGMAVTMDYRPDRVRVSYDEQYNITSIRCG
ncbi:peptidase inhibitor I78 [Erythrobacter sp. SDW2]|uniref:I78 family peptidase inhibitor n=1 Tax=Erythrobacter sp. SDW2 TaxID=2907154 RepID=UPI001EEF164B|nr:I78 family peptidase inhibitor [Erythrobacter sp. SDW2]UIP06721.1 peptidase inhibitor I78 [Erythrobacter sp. SDW2]